jgi:hypothetical protein
MKYNFHILTLFINLNSKMKKNLILQTAASPIYNITYNQETLQTTAALKQLK